MPSGLSDHPLRHALSEELHARPFARLQAPRRATHLALLSGENAAAADRRHVAALCQRFGAPPPADTDTHFMADLGAFQLKWERHTEFSTYTFFVTPDEAPSPGSRDVFETKGLAEVPRDWLEALSGELLVGVHLSLMPRDEAVPGTDEIARAFGTGNLAGSMASGEAAAVFVDFRIHADGFGRILVHDRHLQPRQAGRLVQRLFEIETYRAMALLALPVARQYGRDLTDAGDRLSDMTGRMAAMGGLEDERKLLAALTDLSAEVERIAAAASYRFGAARAYYALVRRRVEELREVRVEGLQTIHEFLERRLAPAMRTCEATAERLDTLSGRLSRTGDLLRTRVDIQLESQNSALLRSMDRRARLQLRLQQTVEGLSVAAISYYLVGLISYAAKAGKSAGLPVNPDLLTGLSVPVVVAVLAAGVWRLRRKLKHEEQDQAQED